MRRNSILIGMVIFVFLLSYIFVSKTHADRKRMIPLYAIKTTQSILEETMGQEFTIGGKPFINGAVAVLDNRPQDDYTLILLRLSDRQYIHIPSSCIAYVRITRQEKQERKITLQEIGFTFDSRNLLN